MQKDLKVVEANEPSGSGLDTAWHRSHFLPFFGCIKSITLQPYGFGALAPAEFRVTPTPALARFTPRDDARIEVTDDGQNPDSIDI